MTGVVAVPVVAAGSGLLDTIAQAEVLRAAWDRVREGGGSPGADAESTVAFERDLDERLDELAARIRARRYVPLPLRAVRIPKHLSATGRELLLPAVEDRVVQRALLDQVADAFEARFLPSSFGYRAGRSARDAVQQARSAIAARPWIADCDIEGFFDSVDHDELREELEPWVADDEILTLIAAWVEAPALRGETVVRRESGLPTGAVISPLLANIFLHRLDIALWRPDHTYLRFADDFIVCCASESDAQRAMSVAREVLRELGCELNEQKSRVADTRESSVAFLGHVLRSGPTSDEPELDTPRARPLFVTEPGTVIRRSGERLIVTKDGAELLAVPIRKVTGIVAHGSVQLTAPAILECMERGIDIVYLTRWGRWAGRLSTSRSPVPSLRYAQLLVSLDAGWSLRLARSFVAGKIHNQKRLLQRQAARHGLRELDPALADIGRMADAVGSAATLDELRGTEGLASRRFFESLPLVLDDSHGFTARRRRPPTDPVNSLLSYGYTLLTQEMATALFTVGLDPFVGFLHAMRRNRESLALDLVEEFRTPVVDSLVVRVLNRGILGAEDFVRVDSQGALHLRDAGRRTFLREYDLRMNTLFRHEPTGERVSYRVALLRQAEQLAVCVQALEVDYIPVMLA